MPVHQPNWQALETRADDGMEQAWERLKKVGNDLAHPGSLEGKRPGSSTDAHQIVTKMTQARVADMHTFALLLIFTPPFVLAMWLPCNKEAMYFVGNAAYWAVIVPVLICIIHIVQRYMNTPLKIFFVGSFWLPAIVFVSLGAVYMNSARKYHSGLRSQGDCESFDAGEGLEKAYAAAREVGETCKMTSSIMGCPNYQAAKDEWWYEFEYLAALEAQHPCTGFCNKGTRLWYGAGKPARACRTFVGERLKAVANLSSLLLWYNVWIIIVAAPVYIYLAPVFSKLGYGNLI